MKGPERELELPPIPSGASTSRIQTLAIWVVTGAVALGAGSLFFALTFAQRVHAVPPRQGAVLPRPHCTTPGTLIAPGRAGSLVASATDSTKATIVRYPESRTTTNACP